MKKYKFQHKINKSNITIETSKGISYALDMLTGMRLNSDEWKLIKTK